MLKARSAMMSSEILFITFYKYLFLIYPSEREEEIKEGHRHVAIL